LGKGRFLWTPNEIGRFLIPITAKSGEGETTINLTINLTINVVPDSLYWQWASDFFDRTIPEGISLENLQPDANPTPIWIKMESTISLNWPSSPIPLPQPITTYR
jgi:hypothetical protein